MLTLSPRHQFIEAFTIIGGGPAGLFFADLLKQSDAGKDALIGLYEASDRLGGRAYTVDIPNSGGLYGEMGAMRFSTLHTRFTETLASLNLTTHEAPQLSTQAFHFVRGRRIELTDYQQHPERIPYALSPEENSLTPEMLLDKIFEKIVPGITSVQSLTELKALLDTTQIEGKSLRDWDLSNLVKPHVSEEGYAFLHDTLGFIDHFERFNAYDKLLHNYHGPGKDPYFVVEGGVQSIIKALESRLIDKRINIHKNKTLTAIHLAYEDKKGPVYQCSFADNSIVYTRHVVLTIPPKATLKLDESSFIFEKPEVTTIFETAKRSAKAVKIALMYDAPWWHENGLKNARVHTDLGVRQVYDIGQTDKGAALLIYRDAAPDWKLEDESDRTFYANKEKIPLPLHIPNQIMNAIHGELCDIFGDNTLPLPTTAFGEVWEEGFIQWNPGIHSDKVMETLAHAYKDITFAGDSIGEGTGWIAGVFEGVERAVEQLNEKKKPLQTPTLNRSATPVS